RFFITAQTAGQADPTACQADHGRSPQASDGRVEEPMGFGEKPATRSTFVAGCASAAVRRKGSRSTPKENRGGSLSVSSSGSVASGSGKRVSSSMGAWTTQKTDVPIGIEFAPQQCLLSPS